MHANFQTIRLFYTMTVSYRLSFFFDRFMREEMAATEEEEHASVPMERDVIMSNDYDSLAVLGSNHRSLFSVTPCSLEYQY